MLTLMLKVSGTHVISENGKVVRVYHPKTIDLEEQIFDCSLSGEPISILPFKKVIVDRWQHRGVEEYEFKGIYEVTETFKKTIPRKGTLVVTKGSYIIRLGERLDEA